MSALATVEELEARIEWELSDGEKRIALAALEELSDEARTYGSFTWMDDYTCPQSVRRLVIKAAARWLRNPDGYTQSRAGDETLAWSDRGEDSGAATFTRAERAILKSLGGAPAIYSVETYVGDGFYHTRSGRRDNTGYVPTSDGRKPFPLYADGDV